MTAAVDPGVIAIVRLRRIPAPDALFDALVDSGIRSIEITLPTPDSSTTIARWRERGVGLVGAGTIRTESDVTRAADAGAQFLVTPTTSASVLLAAQKLDLPVICGALTPTEIDTAVNLGAACVKVFPIDAMGGLDYVRAVAAPLHDIRLVPTGGINADNAAGYGAAGCAGIGIGSALVDEETVVAARWQTICERGRSITRAWTEGVTRRA